MASSAKAAASQPKRVLHRAYKLQIVEQYDQLADPRERGALLRQEGLSHSHIQRWREARDQGALRELSDKAGRPSRIRRRWKTSGCGRKTETRYGTGQDEGRAGGSGKARALFELLSESADSARSGKSDRRRIYRAEAVTSAKTTCRLLSKARATLYRQRNSAPLAGRPAAQRAAHPPR